MARPHQYSSRPESPSLISSTFFAGGSSPPHPRLERLIAIPATASARGSPFLRAYPPSLESFSIPQSTFLEFVDTLNRVAAKSPPLTALSLAGDIVGLVPLATTQIVGTALSVGAGLTNSALAYGRTEFELRKANKELFGQRGLKCEIAKLDAIARLTGMPVLNNDGKIDKHATVLEPIKDRGVGESTQQRLLTAMQPWIASLNLQEIPREQGAPSQFSRFHVKINERQKVRSERKTLEKRAKLEEEYEGKMRKHSQKLEKDMDELDEDLAKDMKNIERDRDRAGKGARAEKSEHELARLEKKTARVLEKNEKRKNKLRQDYEQDIKELQQDKLEDDKEESAVRKMLWLIIRESGTAHPEIHNY